MEPLIPKGWRFVDIGEIATKGDMTWNNGSYTKEVTEDVDICKHKYGYFITNRLTK